MKPTLTLLTALLLAPLSVPYRKVLAVENSASALPNPSKTVAR